MVPAVEGSRTAHAGRFGRRRGGAPSRLQQILDSFKFLWYQTINMPLSTMAQCLNH